MDDNERLKRLYAVTNRVPLTAGEAHAFLRILPAASGRDLLSLAEECAAPDDVVWTIAIFAGGAIWKPCVTDLELIDSFVSWVPPTVFGEFGPRCQPGTLPLFWETVCRAMPGLPPPTGFDETAAHAAESIRTKAPWLESRLRARLAADTFPAEVESINAGLACLQAACAAAR